MWKTPAAAVAAFCLATPGLAASPVQPGDDFYAYANAEWLAATPLPAGSTTFDTSAILRARAAERTRGLIEAAADAPGGSALARKVGDYDASWRDRTAIEAKGLAPLADELARIAAIGDRRSLAAYLGRTLRPDDGTNSATEGLFGAWIHQGFHDPDHYVPHIVQGGLGLPDRDDYLGAGPEAAARRELYRAHVATLLQLAGFDQAEARAARVLALETAIARTHASAADTADVFKTDNEWRAEDFAAKAPGLDWDAYFAAAGLGRQRAFVVWQPGAVAGSAALVASQPLEAWRDYLALHLIAHHAAVLPRAFDDERRAFAARLGAPAPDRAAEAIAATNTALGDAVGQLYAAKYFPPSAKAAAVAMAEDLRAAYWARLAATTWISAETRRKALAKLAALKIGVGYPDRWTDYSGLAVVRGDALGNLRRAEAFAWRQALAKLARPVDPAEWALPAQVAGAVIVFSPNAEQFAAGILEPPFFDPAGDMATNYGSAGAGMAHEISHSFDELGRIYDARGRLGDWQSAADTAGRKAAAAPLVAQYDAYCPKPDLCVHGQQVIGEAFADLVGLEVAHDAYRRALHGRPDAVKGGLTGEQRFFLAFARRWRAVRTNAALRQRIASDIHAPGEYRAAVVRNLDAWYAAFDVKPGEALYLPPDKRVRVW